MTPTDEEMKAVAERLARHARWIADGNERPAYPGNQKGDAEFAADLLSRLDRLQKAEAIAAWNTRSPLGREEVARLMYPAAFETFDAYQERARRYAGSGEPVADRIADDLIEAAYRVVEPALTKADAILSLIASGSGSSRDLAPASEALTHPEPGAHAAGVWRPIKTVADLVNNLLTLDQSMAAHGAIFVDYKDQRRARIRPLSLSREKLDGPWIKSGADGPWNLVIWSQADDRALSPPSEAKVSGSDPLAEYDRAMQEKVIPKINADLRRQALVATRLRLGLPSTSEAGQTEGDES